MPAGLLVVRVVVYCVLFVTTALMAPAPTPPPLIMLQGKHQRSKNAKKRVPLSQLRRSLKMEKGVQFFYEKFAFFLKKRGTFHKETRLMGCSVL